LICLGVFFVSFFSSYSRNSTHTLWKTIPMQK
jgi:hypothetical protein